MPKLTVVRNVQDRGKVYFGAWVTLEDEQGEEFRHRIVGADEFDQHDQFITVDSPLARCLLGKTVDDEIEVEQRGESRFFTIIEIEYE